MPDFNPAVLRKMLALRQHPILADIDLAELAVLADNLVDTVYPAGTLVAPAATRLPALHLISDGKITAGERAWGPRQVFAGLEVFAGRPLVAPAIAESDTQTLQLLASDFAELVEDNFGVLRATLRGLATRMLVLGRAPSRSSGPITATPLGLVERLIVLRQQAPFARARLQALAMLAHNANELHWGPGALVTRAGEPATGAIMLVEGSVRIGASRVLGPGDSLGILEVLAGAHHGVTAETDTPTRALHATSSVLLDVLEDHPELGLSMIETFAAALLDSSLEAAAAHVN